MRDFCGDVLCVIPARGGSKGIKRKNLRLFRGYPLVYWPINAAKKSKYISTVCVSTEDIEIAQISEKFGAEVPFYRPEYLSSDETPSIAVLQHALTYYADMGKKFTHVLLLEPTSPLTEHSDIDLAVQTLSKFEDTATSLVGVSQIEATHPAYCMQLDQNGFISSAFDYDLSNLPRRQDLPELYHLDGSLYLSTVNDLLLNKSFYHSKTIGFRMPRWKSGEIDNEIDFILNETLAEAFGPPNGLHKKL